MKITTFILIIHRVLSTNFYIFMIIFSIFLIGFSQGNSKCRKTPFLLSHQKIQDFHFKKSIRGIEYQCYIAFSMIKLPHYRELILSILRPSKSISQKNRNSRKTYENKILIFFSSLSVFYLFILVLNSISFP